MPTRTTKSGLPGNPETLTAAEVPAMRAMLGGVRTEVHPRIDHPVEEPKVDTVKPDATIDTFKADMHEIKVVMRAIRAEMARIERMLQEQNAWEKSVVDRLVAQLGIQDRLEQHLSQAKDTWQRSARRDTWSTFSVRDSNSTR